MIKSTSETPAIAFADLESFVRERAQSFIQNVLEEEVEELLGRRKSERRATGDPVGYRNGHGEERRLTTSIGTVKLRRPRVRGTDEQFVSRLLPYFHRHTAQVSQTLPELSLHGLSSGVFDLAMRGLLGGRHLRQGGTREGKSGAPNGDRRSLRWYETGSCRGERLSRK